MCLVELINNVRKKEIRKISRIKRILNKITMFSKEVTELDKNLFNSLDFGLIAHIVQFKVKRSKAKRNNAK